jgi:hypothetical protein
MERENGIWLDQKSSTAACSIGGQELLMGVAAEEIGAGDGP